ncbi:MAG: hypothetical protein COT33_00360 [Candidatus Nealsonbacteria bacterium CG08_land_8_20_14_0_20_38_20]|uniref:Uncharacterized protein n=1 Tax=Candidatus Nealsonbacteria bacterium CG08_land_8_20_14_0_20_38_20 TaxID=1974705 RepID=A0A2H0YPP2_9BACT|nr:MAG: hypothetical protein COT33_00360 [Candidatus Nealsonbacteria bacterium CG08_land_8_20_14_0_20_38_20]
MRFSFERLNKKSFIVGLSSLVLISLLILLSFSLSFKEKRIKGLESQLKNLEKEVSLLKSLPSPGISGSEEFGAGKIGEVETPEETLTVQLPQMISNTEGAILEIKEDRLIVQGSGSNFTDQKPRELTLLFTLETITFEPGQKIKYQGLEGLKHFKKGDKISISSPENIRGKTQIKVDYINKVQ